MTPCVYWYLPPVADPVSDRLDGSAMIVRARIQAHLEATQHGKTQ